MTNFIAGSTFPFGATWTGHGVNFKVFSKNAERIDLCLCDPASGAESSRHEITSRSGNIWQIALPARIAAPGTHYVYHAHGAFAPDTGLRFDAQKPLVDPYARQLILGDPLRACVRDGHFDWGVDRPPSTPWRDTVIYELHVKGFTRRHPAVPEQWRGTYLGMTCEPVLEHLKNLGVTAVELLPCQAFISEDFLRERRLTNYWGYNSLAWFAPAAQYAVQDPVDEFKSMVKALHGAGLEVILDVVFNHTAEGNEGGNTLSLRGLDNPVYYRLNAQDKRYYENITGCGNTVNCEHDQVRTLIVDCLKYWVEEMHVDGFRFDLAPVLARDANGFDANAEIFRALRAEPALAYVKLIAEPWDIGLGGYQLGYFPSGWSEWNDRYRDTVRSFWKHDPGKIGDLAERLAGSSDIFRYRSRKPSASINFITSHDGFTLHDLVSYNERHNEANLEDNRDGHSHNLSWNCGAEGPTDDAVIMQLRLQQMKNLLATLLLSQGVPMLQAGDEFARTQRGNNNAYCQDNEISWLDWSLTPQQRELLGFVCHLTHIRRTRAEFRRETFLKGGARISSSKDVSWLRADGGEMSAEDWQNADLHVLGVKIAAHGTGARDLMLLINGGFEVQVFRLPRLPEGVWRCSFDTATTQTSRAKCDASPCFQEQYRLESHSMVLLEA